MDICVVSVKKALVPAVTFAITFLAPQVVIPGANAEDAASCEVPGLSAGQTEECLNKSKDKADKEHPPLKFPAGFQGGEFAPTQIYMTDSKEWVDAGVTSDGNTLDLYKAPVCRGFAICVNFKPELIRSIPKERILTYT